MELKSANKFGLAQTNDDDARCPIAIIGMACRMPGVTSLAEYRQVLVDQTCTYGEVPKDRWSQDEWYGGPETKLGFTNSKTAGFLPNLCSFDNTFFNTSPKEALSMDPQQYQIMECCQEALDDAGLTKQTIPRNTAVYMSMKMGEQTLVCAENRNILNPYILTGGAHTVTANRVNYFFDIRGPSMGVEGSCSAALHSVHFGVWSLWNKECDAVIAGGVNHILSPHFHMNQCQAGLLSRKGDAAPFDASSDGRVRAEGVGCIIMKTLPDAIRDGDHVHCVIRASVLGYHGNTLSLIQHDSNAIAKTIGRLYTEFGLSPSQVDYIEAHATGIVDEDRQEAKALTKVFRNRSTKLKIGSCKANIGHSESASGMAQLIKAAIMLENREYLPQRNFSGWSSDIGFDCSNLEVQTSRESYVAEKNMMIGVNSLAFSGQIVHSVLEESKSESKEVPDTDLAGWKFSSDGGRGRTVIIALSAKSKSALKAMAQSWIEYENSRNDAQVVAAWMAMKRSHYNHRLVLFARSPEQFRNSLNNFITDSADEYRVSSEVTPNFARPKLCFIFPGQGQQWKGMGRQLYASEPVYRRIVDRCDDVWQREAGYSFMEKHKLFIEGGEGCEDIDEIIVCQPAIVSHQIGLSVLLQHWGIRSDLLLGHSLGEVAAAHVAGGMTLDECMTSIYHRAYTQSKLSGTGAMAACRLGPEAAEQFCKDEKGLYVACYNSTDNVTLAGEHDVLRRLAEDNPRLIKMIRVKAAFHTVLMHPVRDEFFRRMIGKYECKICGEGPIFYSSVYKEAYKGPFDTEYWWKNIEEPVHFAQANKKLFEEQGSHVIFVEISSSNTLLSSIRQTAQSLGVQPTAYIACGSRNSDDHLAALKGFSSLYTTGLDVDWRNVMRNCARYVQVPNYPFQRMSFRLESELYAARRLGQEDKSYSGCFGQIGAQMHPHLYDYVIHDTCTFPSSGFVEYFMQEALRTSNTLQEIHIFANPELFRRSVLGTYQRLFLEMIEDGRKLTVKTAHVWNKSQQQEDREYATCLKAQGSTLEVPYQLNIESISAICPVKLTSAEIYTSFARAGMKYGEAFRVVKQLVVGEGKTLGRLLPAANKDETIQTVTLDGAFQIAIAAFGHLNTAYSVTFIEYVHLKNEKLPLNKELIVYANLIRIVTEGFVSDMYIAGTNGVVLACCIGCQFDKLQSEVEPKTSSQGLNYIRGYTDVNHDQKNGSKETMCSFLADLLQWPPEHFEEDVPLREYGLDNILGHEFLLWLQNTFRLAYTLLDISQGLTMGNILQQLQTNLSHHN